MLIVTDKLAVDAAFEAKAPRPIREVMLEIYPDATEDCNGRFHAPYNGYECQITGKLFRAGEYLPMDEPDDNYRVMGPGRKFPEAVDPEGKAHAWTGGTRAQNLAAWAVLFEQSREYDKAKSNHVGEVGKMVTLEDLTLQFVKGFDGYYGTTWIHVLKDPNGNVVVYKGGKRLRPYRTRDWGLDLEKGEKITLRCKVKEHGEREGVKQTIIERPKTVQI